MVMVPAVCVTAPADEIMLRFAPTPRVPLWVMLPKAEKVAVPNVTFMVPAWEIVPAVALKMAFPADTVIVPFCVTPVDPEKVAFPVVAVIKPL